MRHHVRRQHRVHLLLHFLELPVRHPFPGALPEVDRNSFRVPLPESAERVAFPFLAGC